MAGARQCSFWGTTSSRPTGMYLQAGWVDGPCDDTVRRGGSWWEAHSRLANDHRVSTPTDWVAAVVHSPQVPLDAGQGVLKC
jgi:hypothetical protein